MALWTPANEPSQTYELWLDADDASTITESLGDVSQWDDKSGYARHAAQAIGSRQPTTDSVTIGTNSLNAISFDGTDDFLQADAVSQALGTGTFGIYIVMTSPTSATTGYVLSMRESSGGTTRFYFRRRSTNTLGFRAGDSAWNEESWTDGTDTLATLHKTSSSVTDWWLDGNAKTGHTGVTYSAAFGLFTLGATRTTAFSDVKLGEVVVADLTNREKIEGYLAWKWGLTLPSGHPYEFAAPTTGGHPVGGLALMGVGI